MSDERKEYKGRLIEVSENEKNTERGAFQVIIDGEIYRGGRDSAGLYYLEIYAFDRVGSQIEAAKRYVDHLERRRAAEKEAD